MAPSDFFELSGVLAWLFLLSRGVRSLKGLTARLRWALFGSRKVIAGRNR